MIVRDDKIVRFHLGKIEDNALLRTKLRCSVDVIENYTELPLVDRVMMKGKDEVTGAEYWRLVCLLHYIVKSYTGTLEPAI